VIEIKNDYILKDMVISAFRYSLGRHSYIVPETIEFIQNNPQLIDQRVKGVMLRDLEEYKDYISSEWKEWSEFKTWLESIEKGV
jgi:hypothetical protein